MPIRNRLRNLKDRTVHGIPVIGPLREIIERRRTERTGPYVFSYADGRPIGSYKNAWKGALKSAGLSGKLFHDLRRVAATELRRSGVSEDVAMVITGHRTRSMFSRYNIVDLGHVSRAIEQRRSVPPTSTNRAAHYNPPYSETKKSAKSSRKSPKTQARTSPVALRNSFRFMAKEWLLR